MKHPFHNPATPTSQPTLQAQLLLSLLKTGARRQTTLLRNLGEDLTGLQYARQELRANGHDVQTAYRDGEMWWHLDRSGH